MATSGKLSLRQQKSIPFLLAARTTKEAGLQAKVSEFTLCRWLAQPAFQAAYRAARHVIMDEALAVLQKSCTRAVEVMVEVLESTEAPEIVRLRAAHMILDIAVRGRSVQELEDRLAALEQASVTERFAEAD